MLELTEAACDEGVNDDGNTVSDPPYCAFRTAIYIVYSKNRVLEFRFRKRLRPSALTPRPSHAITPITVLARSTGKQLHPHLIQSRWQLNKDKTMQCVYKEMLETLGLAKEQ